METSNKIDGYVYVARIIDHGGKFVNGYHKIGLSKQYKIREAKNIEFYFWKALC